MPRRGEAGTPFPPPCSPLGPPRGKRGSAHPLLLGVVSDRRSPPLESIPASELTTSPLNAVTLPDGQVDPRAIPTAEGARGGSALGHEWSWETGASEHSRLCLSPQK